MSDALAQSDTPRRPYACLLTAGGRGAIASIRFSGDIGRLDAGSHGLFRAASGCPLGEQSVGRIVFGYWGRQDAREEVVVCRVDAETLEIHCHGGMTAARRILADLESCGCRVVTWKELHRAALGVLECETFEALTQAPTERTARILLEQHNGLLRSALESIAALAASASVMSKPPKTPAADLCRETMERLESLLGWSRFGLHLTQPWRVVLVGRPNVGKSSLINALVGYARSIVSAEPGTTRDVVHVQMALDGWPIELSDTAGMRADAGPLESAGIARARQTIESADCLLVVIDTSEPPSDEDRRLLAQWPQALVIAHKCDLPDSWGDAMAREALRVSSLTGAGVDDLAQAIVARLAPSVPPSGTPIPVTPRQVSLLERAHAALKRGDERTFQAVMRECAGAP